MANQIPQAKTKQSNLYFQTDQEAIQVLEKEGRKLMDIAKKVWRKYLASYTPKEYIRTGKTERGIKLGSVKKIGDNEHGIELTFQNDLMYHESVISQSEPKGHSIMLLSSGWTARKLESKIGIRENFTRHKGINYIGEVVKAYQSSKHRGIDLEVQWSGKFLSR
ncbi:hypothetical protein [Bacillus mojavensis]